MDEPFVNDIISRYPYPVAILYRIVAGLKEEPGKRVEYILQTAESVARLLGMIALSELHVLKVKGNIEIPDSIRTDFKKNIKRPGFGVWMNVAREGLSHLKKAGAEIVIPELQDLFYEGKKETDFKAALDKLIKLRNAIAHRKVALDTADKELSAANISLNYLNTVLTRLAFFKDVSFGYIQSIEVNKKPRRQPEFLHKGKTLNGNSIGKGINLSHTLTNFKETDMIIIRYDSETYLNLFPFYIYDASCGNAADVFYYNGTDKNRLEYIGIDPGGKFFVENQDEAPCSDVNVDEEYDQLLAGCGRKKNVKYSTELHREFDHITGLLG